MFRILAMVLSTGCVATGLAYAAFSGGSTEAARVYALSDPSAYYHFEGVVQIDPDTTHVAGQWTIYLDQPETDTLTYWLKDSLGDIEVSGPGVAGFSVDPEGAPPGIQAITVELAPVADAPREIAFSYQGVLLPEPLPNTINSISQDLVEFTVDSFWQPFDARFDQFVTAEVDLRIPGDWTPVTTGRAQAHAQGIHFVFERPTRDFPITLLTQYTIETSERYRIFDTRPDAPDLTAFGEMVGFCTSFLDARFGEREPLPQANIVIHQRDTSGYARGTLIALTDIGDSFDDAVQRFICHELAHFWASNGNPGTVENWINESFAEQIERLETQLEIMGPEPSIWTPDDLSRRPHGVNYVKGPLALAALEARIGVQAFEDFTRRMMVERVATTPELLDTLAAVAGGDHRRWFEARLAQ